MFINVGPIPYFLKIKKSFYFGGFPDRGEGWFHQQKYPQFVNQKVGGKDEK